MGVLTGMGSGLGITLFANWLRNARVLQKPWEHVLMMGLGGYAAVKWEAYDAKIRSNLIHDIEVMDRVALPDNQQKNA